MTMSATEVNQLKQAQTATGVMREIQHRWSPRSFSEQEVSSSDLRTIFEAVRWAPSSFNEQPWRFLVGTRGSEAYKRIFDSLGEFNQAWAKTAPVLILGAAKSTFSHNGTENVVALYDLGAAAATLCYQAISMGIFTHQMGGYDREVARRKFAIPQDFMLGAVIALGYLGEPAALSSPQMQEQEVSPRQRKPLDTIALSDWDKPLLFS